MEKKIHIVCDEFLPKEQRDNLNKPEWVARLHEYMSEVMTDLQTIYAEVSDPEVRAEQMIARLGKESIGEIIGKDVLPLMEIVMDPNGDTLKLTVTFKQGKNMPQELTFVHTAILKQQKL